MEISQINQLIEEKRRKHNSPMIQSLMSILYTYKRFKNDLAEYKEKKLEYSVNPRDMLELWLKSTYEDLRMQILSLRMDLQSDIILLRGGTFNAERVKIINPEQYTPIWYRLLEEIGQEEIELNHIMAFRSEIDMLREENAYLKIKIQVLEGKNE